MTTDSRIVAAAVAQYELETGCDWDQLPYPEQDARFARAEAVLAQVDAADNRVRLTLPEFNAIRADALSDLGREMRGAFDGGLHRTIESAGVFNLIDERSNALSDRFLEPLDVHGATDSLIEERVAAELEKTADHLDAASLSDVAPDTEPRPGEKTARLRRRVVNGCADWLRTRASELKSGHGRLYARVDTHLAVDEDQLTALRSTLDAEIDRAEQIAQAQASLGLPPFIFADRLREAIDAVTPAQEAAG